MALAPQAAEIDILNVVEKLRHARARIVQCVEWARATEEVWRSLNEGEQRRTVAASPASQAAFIYERATRDAQILMITRVFDRPSKNGALLTNRQSFPVCRDLLDLPGVTEWLIKDALTWPNGLAHLNSQHVQEHLVRFRERLTALEQEQNPNRQALLRAFRDENIAHELHFVDQRERPLYRHVTELLDEIKLLAEHLSFVVEGTVVRWDDTGLARRSGLALWAAVARCYPL
jgi:hypothetical protein